MCKSGCCQINRPGGFADDESSMARKRNTIGCLFYIALVLLVLVIFLFNRARVQQVIEKTGFARLFEKKKDTPGH